MDSVGCDDDNGNCPSNTVVVTDKDSFDHSNGPVRFTNYTLLLTGIAIAASLIAVPFLPSSKEECHEWKMKGEALGTSKVRGYLSLGIAVIMISVSEFSYQSTLCSNNLFLMISLFFSHPLFHSMVCRAQFFCWMWIPLVNLQWVDLDAKHSINQSLTHYKKKI
jgi:hypothetical protein